ncbi:hypothetical protein BJ742DRAFT_742577 [Cladochytrium replicatum]|nr:hypothetical protein BJ742DRAFT_742577 [Cladochytrium replicatum]
MEQMRLGRMNRLNISNLNFALCVQFRACSVISVSSDQSPIRSSRIEVHKFNQTLLMNNRSQKLPIMNAQENGSLIPESSARRTFARLSCQSILSRTEQLIPIVMDQQGYHFGSRIIILIGNIKFPRRFFTTIFGPQLQKAWNHRGLATVVPFVNGSGDLVLLIDSTSFIAWIDVAVIATIGIIGVCLGRRRSASFIHSMGNWNNFNDDVDSVTCKPSLLSILKGDRVLSQNEGSTAAASDRSKRRRFL